MSLTAAWALGLAVPRTWIRFLGILPLAIGVKELVQMHEEKPAVLAGRCESSSVGDPLSFRSECHHACAIHFRSLAYSALACW